MSERRDRGLFIVIEGIDNSGKTTQSTLLKEYLEGKGLSVIQTREPGGTEVGEEVRAIVKKDRSGNKLMHQVTQALLFYAARNEFLREVVKPSLDQGITVITDRFVPSSYVYQGLVQGVNIGLLEVLTHQVVGNSGCTPDLVVILDISAEESLLRQAQVDSRGEGLIFEKQGREFIEKLRQGYLDFAQRFSPAIGTIEKSYDILTVNGELEKDVIYRQIAHVVDLKLQVMKTLYG